MSPRIVLAWLRRLAGQFTGVAASVGFALFAVLGMIGVVQADTAVGGAIAVNTAWTVSDSPYIVTQDVVVQNGARLSIEAGTSIYMALGTSLSVQNGSLQAFGTGAKPVQVTSQKLQSGQTAAPGDWGRWTFNAGTSTTVLEHVVFSYGQGLVVNGSAPVFNYLSIHHHSGPAISLDRSASPSGVSNQAHDNALNAVAVPAGDITGNVTWGLRGIPYLVSGGVLSVGSSPVVASVSPTSIEQGETANVAITGSRLDGLSAVQVGAGISAQILPGGSSSQATIALSATNDAPIGALALNLLVNAGEINVPNMLSLRRARPVLSALNPALIHVGRGAIQITLSGKNFDAATETLLNGTPLATAVSSSTLAVATVPNLTTPSVMQVGLRIPDPDHAGQFLFSNTLSLTSETPRLVLDPGSATVVNGNTQSLQLITPYPAPAGGLNVNLVSSVPSVATVPANITVPEGATSAVVSVAAVGVGASTITASKTGFTPTQTQISVIPPPRLTLTSSLTTLGSGRQTSITVTSSQLAGPEGLVVGVTSSDVDAVSAPATVTIPAGSNNVVFQASTLALGVATVEAQATGFLAGTIDITVRAASVVMPQASLVAPGLSRSIPMTLSDPAPVGGLQVAFQSSNTAVLAQPAPITLAEGATVANVTITGVATGQASLTASANGYQSGSTAVSIEAITISLGVGSAAIPETVQQRFNVSLSKPAPAGGVTIDFSIADTSKASVTPATLTIPQGQTAPANSFIDVTGVAKGTTSLTATAPGLTTATVNLTIKSKPELRFSMGTVKVGKGLKTYQSEVHVHRRVEGSVFYGTEALTVALTSSDPTKVSVPATVTIPANSYYAYFTVTGVDLTDATSVTIDAAANGYTAPATKLAASVVQPTPIFQSLDGTRSTDSVRDDFYIQLRVTGANYPDSQTAVVDMPIDLAIVQDTPAGLVPGFHDRATSGNAISQVVIKAGYDNSYYASGNKFTYVDQPLQTGSYRVQATNVSGASALSAVQTVTAPELRFSTSVVTVGKGLNTYQSEVYVYRAINGSAFNSTQALTVSLTSNDPGKVSVPATVTIPANSYYGYFLVTGVDLTDATPVTIDAAANGYTAPATKLAASVVQPTLILQSLAGTRSMDSARDDFYVQLRVTGANYPDSQTSVVDMPIDLAIVQDTPVGLVPGFHDSATAGNAISQAVIMAGQSQSAYSNQYVDQPTSAGSYKIQAMTASGASGLSALQTVIAPELWFSTSVVTVGKGLNTYQNEVYVYRAINGSAFSGTQALTVSLTSNDPGKVSVPATVTIPANSYYGYFLVTGVDLTDATSVTIDAAANGYTAPATKLAASVVQPTLILQSLAGTRSMDSARDDFYVQLRVTGANYPDSQTSVVDMPIDLAIVQDIPVGLVPGFHDSATAGNAISQVVIKAGYNNSYTASGNKFTYVDQPTSAGSYKIQAMPASGASGLSALQTVIAPELRFSTSVVTVGKGLNTYQNEVYVYRAINGSAFSGTQALTVSLACSATAVCTVPATVTIPANTYYTYFTVTGVDLGSTTITATAVGYNSTQDLSVNVVTPTLSFNGPNSAKAGQASSFTLGLLTPGASYSGSQKAIAPITVNLTSSAPEVGMVPVSTTVAAGATSSASTSFQGVTAGSTTLTASGTDLQTATKSVTVAP